MRSSWDVVDRRAVNYLWDLVVKKLLEFASGRRELSELEEKYVKYWKEWLRKYQSSEGPYYHAKGHAWKHINDAAQVDRGLALLDIVAPWNFNIGDTYLREVRAYIFALFIDMNGSVEVLQGVVIGLFDMTQKLPTPPMRESNLKFVP
ncbi:hypothetical protein FOXB_15588 [Fusarium oxysporum f. sp. conglutinans Fo5176]|uniref:Thymidylate synthase/dCMP hydroxymethylase domain-containing protein n=1 Tax=Fusarium oxysporum (strain Fo5176) TaxID=660025 RepID=F9GAA6_FUSOF|nr:hypothetical protein FOXB_15588 [Fusarium oxysporum f. sp. conglutinans Fo5176]